MNFHIGQTHCIIDRNGFCIEGHYWPFNNYYVNQGDAHWYPWYQAPALWLLERLGRLPVDCTVTRRDHCLDISWSRQWPFITVVSKY